MANNSDLWMQRWYRLLETQQHRYEDFLRWFLWYLSGGRGDFLTKAPEIISEHKWCFIVGCNNSGTSVLQTLLERSGQISTLPREGQHYSSVLTRGHRKGYERVWSEFIDEIVMTESDSLKVVPRLIHDWMRSMPQPIKPIIVEKTTLNAVRMRWLQAAFPRSYFIGLVRNGYAVCEGIKRKGKKDVNRAAIHWSLVNKIMLEDAQLVDRFFLLKYEDLVGKPEAAAKKLADFLGLDRSALLDTLDTGFSFETLEGRKDQKLKDFNSKSIALLDPEEILSINRLAGEMLTTLKYKIL